MRTIFDWLDFKEVADKLAEYDDEKYIRSAIIMYYYAIFSAIREYLINVKNQYQFIDNRDVHKRVWKFLLKYGNDNEREVGEFLGKVRGVRNHANYDKKYGYDYFQEQLSNILMRIDNVVNSILFLRNSY